MRERKKERRRKRERERERENIYIHIFECAYWRIRECIRTQHSFLQQRTLYVSTGIANRDPRTLASSATDCSHRKVNWTLISTGNQNLQRRALSDWFALGFINASASQRTFFFFYNIRYRIESKEYCFTENDRDFSVKNFFQISYLSRFTEIVGTRLASARKSVACEIAAKEIENERIRISTIKPLVAPIGRGSLNWMTESHHR